MPPRRNRSPLTLARRLSRALVGRGVGDSGPQQETFNLLYKVGGSAATAVHGRHTLTYAGHTTNNFVDYLTAVAAKALLEEVYGEVTVTLVSKGYRVAVADPPGNLTNPTLNSDATYLLNDGTGTAPHVESNVGAKAEFWVFTVDYTGTINFGNGDASGSVDATAGVISSVSAPSGFTAVSGGIGDFGVKFRAVGNAAQAAFSISPTAGASYIDFAVLGTDPVVVISFTGEAGWITIDDDYFANPAIAVIPLTATEGEITDLLNGVIKYDNNVESVVKTSTSLTINFFQFFGSGPAAITVGGVTGAAVAASITGVQDGSL